MCSIGHVFWHPPEARNGNPPCPGSTAGRCPCKGTRYSAGDNGPTVSAAQRSRYLRASAQETQGSRANNDGPGKPPGKGRHHPVVEQHSASAGISCGRWNTSFDSAVISCGRWTASGRPRKFEKNHHTTIGGRMARNTPESRHGRESVP